MKVRADEAIQSIQPIQPLRSPRSLREEKGVEDGRGVPCRGRGLEYDRLIVYGEATRLLRETLAAEKIEFRQTPYDLVFGR